MFSPYLTSPGLFASLLSHPYFRFVILFGPTPDYHTPFELDTYTYASPCPCCLVQNYEKQKSCTPPSLSYSFFRYRLGLGQLDVCI